MMMMVMIMVKIYKIAMIMVMMMVVLQPNLYLSYITFKIQDRLGKAKQAVDATLADQL